MDNVDVLDCFIKMPSPSKNEILKRERKVKEAIEKMGSKYRLSNLILKKGAKNES